MWNPCTNRRDEFVCLEMRWSSGNYGYQISFFVVVVDVNLIKRLRVLGINWINCDVGMKRFIQQVITYVLNDNLSANLSFEENIDNISLWGHVTLRGFRGVCCQCFLWTISWPKDYRSKLFSKIAQRWDERLRDGKHLLETWKISRRWSSWNRKWSTYFSFLHICNRLTDLTLLSFTQSCLQNSLKLSIVRSDDCLSIPPFLDTFSRKILDDVWAGYVALTYFEMG